MPRSVGTSLGALAGEDLLLQGLCARYRKVLEWGWAWALLVSPAMGVALDLFDVEVTPLWAPVALRSKRAGGVEGPAGGRRLVWGGRGALSSVPSLCQQPRGNPAGPPRGPRAALSHTPSRSVM